MKMNFLKTKKFRYGALATAMTAVFIAVVVLLNVIFTALCQHYLWYADLTEEEVFSLSEASKEYLHDIDDEIFIYFCNDQDKVETNSYLRYVYNTAKLIADENDRIKVECHNARLEKNFFEPFLSSSVGAIELSSVIVYNATSGESRVMAYNTFFVIDEESQSIWAYNGEYKFLSALLQITSAEMPVVYFTTGHGEDVTEGFAPLQDEEGNYTVSGAYHLASLFLDSGFDVRTINLARETIDPDARIIVIFDPQYDFIGSAEAEDPARNEINKLNDFLTVDDNALMVFGSSDASSAFVYDDKGNPTSNLAEFLDEWGLAYQTGSLVRDYEHSYSVDGLTVQPMYGEGTMGSSIYSTLLDLSSMPMTVIRNSMAIRLTRGESFSKNAYDLCEVSPILTSYDSASLLYNGEERETGSFNLAAVSRARRILESGSNNGQYFANYRFSYVLMFGAPSFASSSYLYSNVYANRDILFAAMKAVGRDTLLASIDFKVLDDDSITVTTQQAHILTAVMSCAIPAVIAAVGIVVCVRRKHS